MLNHIKIGAKAALEATTLLNLGKINVICGRNNSGKSTLLASIIASDRSFQGLTLSTEQLDQMVMEYCQGTIFLSDNRLNVQGLHLKDVFMGATRRVWFRDERDLFVSEFQQRYSKSSVRTIAVQLNRVANSFDRLLSEGMPVAVLVPPKRNIELMAHIQQSKVVESGAGLLGNLFFSKNQEEGTPARNQYEEIRREFTNISSGFELSLIQNQSSQACLRVKTPQGLYVDAADCGLGLQDLLLILYFATSKDNDLLLIEEPESHLHPEMQRKLLGFFASLDKQVFLATHSNIFLDSTFVDKVFFTKLDGKIKTSDETTRAMILGDLGYQVTDNLVSDLIVLVEGPKDVPIYEHFLSEMGVIPRYLVKFWPLGGDIMAQLDLSVFSEKYKIISIVDKDPKSGKVREAFREKCSEAKIEMFQLDRYAIENYFTVAAVRSVFGAQVPEDMCEFKTNVSLEKQLGFDVKKSNRKIVRAMQLDDVRSTDLYSILETVRLKCQSSGGGV